MFEAMNEVISFGFFQMELLLFKEKDSSDKE